MHCKYYNKDEEPTKLEQQTPEKKIGLWLQPNPVGRHHSEDTRTMQFRPIVYAEG